MLIPGRLKRYVSLLSLLLLVTCAGPPATASATSSYSTSAYGNCSYEKCPTGTNTQTTLPSGLKVAINLANGQIIPKSGYIIEVTPLNGQGTSFQTAMFSINGATLQTVTPDITGTARWDWVPASDLTDATVTIDIHAASAATTETFHVYIGTAPVAALSKTPPATNGALSESISKAAQQVYKSAKYVVRTLPKPIVYSFPYLLFVLLAINVLLLIVQTQREVTAYHALQILLARQRNAAASKRTLVELLAHYFRTPLTILLGGIDLISDRTSETVITLKHIGEQLRLTIEELLADIRLTSEPATAAKGASSSAVWRQPGLLIPLALIAVIVVPFNYVARNAGTLTITQTNLVIQGVLYTFLVVGSYFVLRWRHLHLRNAQELERAVAQEQATEEARDQAVTQATSTLEANLDTLSELASHLPSSPASNFIKNGLIRFRSLDSKLTAASRLRSNRVAEKPIDVRLNDIVTDALKTLQDTITARHIIIQRQTDDSIATIRNESLLIFVVRTVLDNAIAYSDDDSTIRVIMKHEKDHVALHVIDSGVGISVEKLSLLFQPFSKAEGAEVFNHEGMGFSLYLDKLIMEYLGGSITLTSKPHRGTTVVISIPKTV